MLNRRKNVEIKRFLLLYKYFRMHERYWQEQLDQMEINIELSILLCDVKILIESINNINYLYCSVDKRLSLLVKNRRKYKKRKYMITDTLSQR